MCLQGRGAARERRLLPARGCERRQMLPARDTADRRRRLSANERIIAAALRRPQLSATAAGGGTPACPDGKPRNSDGNCPPAQTAPGQGLATEACRCEAGNEVRMRAANACRRQRRSRRSRKRKEAAAEVVGDRNRHRASVSGSALAAAVREAESLPVAAEGLPGATVQGRWGADYVNR